MGDIANKEQAEKCNDIAKGCLAKGDYAKASKFFAKSLSLYELPGVDALKNIADNKLREAENGGTQSNGSTNSPKKSANPANPNHPREKEKGRSSSSNGETESGKSTGTSGRPYTEMQEEESKRILSLAKKSHYEVLSLSRSCTEEEVKKAYRKQALKFHPDKNSAPSSEGAFKAISLAVEILSDKEKRSLYDEIGHKAYNNEGGDEGGGGGGGMRFRRRGGRGMDGEMSPEDVFNMFFHGMDP
eukprot:CAMPEP_0182429916 /NCGR_PEP_ID=MMETSP1167-20130531/35085_1 /TAXON_ID=2988 /ORGANISM="Mallomonas Sp, Strain CCMP3275" /LENGTH=243 /DNA_ID=CAMNT_0024614327 /DNA_START=109 /DNA_END=837 /DNA_ORIENTATION=-